ncbi:MAG: hypothetical protein WAM58_09005 [Candidatus Acidiferrum sp.]
MNFTKISRALLALVCALSFASLSKLSNAQEAPPKYRDYPSEIPAKIVPVTSSFEYVKRDVMIPMRDGVKLHTVIVMLKGTRTRPSC